MKTKEITLLGEKVIISERRASDVLELADFTKGKEITDKLAVYINARCAEDALKNFVNEIPWWRIIKRIKMKRLCQAKNLINKAAISQLSEIAFSVLEMEGFDTKKKVAPDAEEENQSAAEPSNV